MYRNTKLATCCYCGMRATLVLGEDRHALVCGGCGAPLANLKNLPIGGNSEKVSPAGVAAGSATALGGKPGQKRKSKKKSRKSRFRKVLGDIFDEIEDIFD